MLGWWCHISGLAFFFVEVVCLSVSFVGLMGEFFTLFYSNVFYCLVVSFTTTLPPPQMSLDSGLKDDTVHVSLSVIVIACSAYDNNPGT